MNVVHPKPAHYTKITVESIAEKLADQFEYKPGKNLFEFVETLGGKVRVVDFWDTSEEHGAMVARDYNDFTINIPDHTSVRRDNFTIAHELGHYFLHYLRIMDQFEKTDIFIAKRFGSHRVEWEANWFASAFLMPSPIFKKIFTKSGGNFYEIADHFCVSVQAAEIRSKRLGCIG